MIAQTLEIVRIWNTPAPLQSPCQLPPPEVDPAQRNSDKARARRKGLELRGRGPQNRAEQPRGPGAERARGGCFQPARSVLEKRAYCLRALQPVNGGPPD